MNETMNDTARDALNTIIAAHATPELAAETISDYLFDPAAISSPSMIQSLDTLISILATDPDDTDDSEIADALALINPEFSAIFCASTELCPEHFSDPENCADEH